jgi:hypothetical protein
VHEQLPSCYSATAPALTTAPLASARRHVRGTRLPPPGLRDRRGGAGGGTTLDSNYSITLFTQGRPGVLEVGLTAKAAHSLAHKRSLSSLRTHWLRTPSPSLRGRWSPTRLNGPSPWPTAPRAAPREGEAWWRWTTIGRCETLQHTATHRNTLQHTATHRNTLQH